MAYHHSEQIGGCKHFGVWPLSQAAQACFGTDQWPAERPVPQVSIEFDVADAAAVAAAAQELQDAGHDLLHPRARSRGVRRWRGCSRRRGRSSGSRTRPRCTREALPQQRDGESGPVPILVRASSSVSAMGANV